NWRKDKIMAPYLILYASRYGQTQKIANYISEDLSSWGITCDLVDCRRFHQSMDLTQYQALIIGAPVYMGSYPSCLRKWIKANPTFKNIIPVTAFFSVCLGIQQPNREGQDKEKKILQDFLDWARWQPQHKAIFAGALNYGSYNWPLKKV